MKGLAFIQDPDGYWIEILSPNNMFTIMSYKRQTEIVQTDLVRKKDVMKK